MNKNYMKFELVDNTNLNHFNESCELKRTWYGEQEDGQILDIETYYLMCKEFAAAMGFAQSTIEEWFGNY